MNVLLHYIRLSSLWPLTVLVLLNILLIATAAVVTTGINPFTETSKYPLNIPHLNRFECNDQGEGKRINIIVSAYSQAQILKDSFCDSSLISSNSGTAIDWGLDDLTIIDRMRSGEVDIVFGRPHLRHDKIVKELNEYEVLAQYNVFTSYFISKIDFELSKRGLIGKNIGIMEDKSSRSGHLTPVKALQTLGIQPADIKMIYAKSHLELRELLSDGQVDIIGSYWNDKDKLAHPTIYSKPIKDGIESNQWLIRGSLVGSSLSCLTQQILIEHRNHTCKINPNDYFCHMEIVANDCR